MKSDKRVKSKYRQGKKCTWYVIKIQSTITKDQNITTQYIYKLVYCTFHTKGQNNTKDMVLEECSQS